MEKFDLEGLIILESSQDNHHIVFNKPVKRIENIAIIAWTCKVADKPKLTAWFLNICIRNHPILRSSWKGTKPPPKIVYPMGKQDKRIAKYLFYREIVLNASADVP
jgi:hypothetical protein